MPASPQGGGGRVSPPRPPVPPTCRTRGPERPTSRRMAPPTAATTSPAAATARLSTTTRRRRPAAVTATGQAPSGPFPSPTLPSPPTPRPAGLSGHKGQTATLSAVPPSPTGSGAKAGKAVASETFKGGLAGLGCSTPSFCQAPPSTATTAEGIAKGRCPPRPAAAAAHTAPSSTTHRIPGRLFCNLPH